MQDQGRVGQDKNEEMGLVRSGVDSRASLGAGRQEVRQTGKKAKRQAGGQASRQALTRQKAR